MATYQKTQYNDLAVHYNSNEYRQLPMPQLEQQLIAKALGDCTGLKILDLGGGSGFHARQAINAGAQLVDVVDISEAMIKMGKDKEAQATREGRIRWHIADATQPLQEQGADVLPPGQYDLVMANWLLDHAGSVEELKSIWQNLAVSLKPGGRFLGARGYYPGMKAKYVTEGKYGCKYHDCETIPGGMMGRATMIYEPGFSLVARTMDDSGSMTNEIPRQLGFTDFKIVPPEDVEVVRKDPGFWKTYLDNPFFIAVTAKKA